MASISFDKRYHLRTEPIWLELDSALSRPDAKVGVSYVLDGDDFQRTAPNGAGVRVDISEVLGERFERVPPWVEFGSEGTGVPVDIRRDDSANVELASATLFEWTYVPSTCSRSLTALETTAGDGVMLIDSYEEPWLRVAQMTMTGRGELTRASRANVIDAWHLFQQGLGSFKIRARTPDGRLLEDDRLIAVGTWVVAAGRLINYFGEEIVSFTVESRSGIRTTTFTDCFEFEAYFLDAQGGYMAVGFDEEVVGATPDDRRPVSDRRTANDQHNSPRWGTSERTGARTIALTRRVVSEAELQTFRSIARARVAWLPRYGQFVAHVITSASTVGRAGQSFTVELERIAIRGTGRPVDSIDVTTGTGGTGGTTGGAPVYSPPEFRPVSIDADGSAPTS